MYIVITMKSYEIKDRTNILEVVQDNKGYLISKKQIGRITDRKFGEYNIIEKTGAESMQKQAIGLAKTECNSIRAYWTENRKKVHAGILYNPQAQMLDLTNVKIKLHKNKELLCKILQSLDETPLGDILEVHKYHTAEALENAANSLRMKSPEDQTIFLLLRNTLIENSLMPIDKNGEPYDLSLMHIPSFDISRISQENKKLKDAIISYYQLNKEYQEVREDDFVQCMNKMKTDMPGLFASLYNHLADTGQIPAKSPVLAELNLTPEQIEFLINLETPAVNAAFNYFNCRVSDALSAKKGNAAEHWSIRRQDREWIEKHALQINKTLAEMRFSTTPEQMQYYDFCIAVSGIQGMIITEEPSYPEKAKTMFETAQKKQARATIEALL